MKIEGARIPLYLAFKNLTPFINKHLSDVHELVLMYHTEKWLYDRYGGRC